MKHEKLSKEERKKADLEKKCSNNFVRGVISTVIALILYIALPLIVLDALLPRIPEGVDPEGIKALFERWLIAGVPMVILSFPAKYYGLGTVKRFAFTVVRTVAQVLWLLYVIRFGDLSGIVSVDAYVGTLKADLLLKGFVALLILPVVFKIVVAYCDYRDCRGIAAAMGPEDITRDDGIRVKGRFS